MNFTQAVLSEFLGTAFLLAVIVGSGIMGERLAGGNAAIALLANSIATGAGLVALILTFAPVSGAHFNPIISVLMHFRGELDWKALLAYVIAQFVGAVAGTIMANGMFSLPLLEISTKTRPGPALMWSEFVATLGLLLVIHHVSRSKADAVPYAVGCYIATAYWFTASTSFANPAVTVARSLTNTFAGIQPGNMAGFIAAQLTAAAVVVACIRRQRR